ncbi:MAG: triose-phosphate isomerase, partial [Rhodospirillales bacterium]|nr:triose-phosphate isomerase [Rhodospirillales bacterium]
MPHKLIAGNWKMNGLKGAGRELARDLAARARSAAPDCDLLVCPPAQLLIPVGEALADSPVQLGAQDCHAEASGAHTGDIGAPMLADAGCSHVIVGHSERRSDHGESDAQVRAKAAAAAAAGLVPIVCLGETEAERAAGRALAVIESQLRGSLPERGPVGGGTGPAAAGPVVAYEPVWAIGTGKTATAGDIAEAHGHIRGLLREILGRSAGD